MRWEEAGVVVRSPCHDRTWIGHMADATYADTPAGPLRPVKAWCERYVLDTNGAIAVRWRKDVDDWVIEASWDQPEEEATL